MNARIQSRHWEGLVNIVVHDVFKFFVLIPASVTESIIILEFTLQNAAAEIVGCITLLYSGKQIFDERMDHASIQVLRLLPESES